MPYMIVGVFLIVIGIVIMKADTDPVVGSIILIAGIIAAIIGNNKIKKKRS